MAGLPTSAHACRRHCAVNHRQPRCAGKRQPRCAYANSSVKLATSCLQHKQRCLHHVACKLATGTPAACALRRRSWAHGREATGDTAAMTSSCFASPALGRVSRQAVVVERLHATAVSCTKGRAKSARQQPHVVTLRRAELLRREEGQHVVHRVWPWLVCRRPHCMPAGPMCMHTSMYHATLRAAMREHACSSPITAFPPAAPSMVSSRSTASQRLCSRTPAAANSPRSAFATRRGDPDAKPRRGAPPAQAACRLTTRASSPGCRLAPV